jgi:hypothetical protein
MQVSYNLKYRKSNFSNRVLIEKEGEIVIYDKGLRLKGKGAGDKGEFISFSDVKEFYYKGDKLFFITFAKAKYTLSNAGTVFEEFLHAIYKARNEFLIDALFMKQGRLKYEFDGHFERFSKFSKPINKGRGKLRLYEGSLVIVPLDQDAFGLNFNFVNFHEFDEDEYMLKITMDDGVSVIISQVGNDFEVFQEDFNNLVGGMYERIVNEDLKEVFYDFDAGTLLKLAYKVRGGKSASLKDVEKMDKELAERVDEFFFDDEVLREKCEVLEELTDDYSKYYGVAKDPVTKEGTVRWLMYAIPEYNVVSFSILPRWTDESAREAEAGAEAVAGKSHDTYFFKIIMEKGLPSEKVGDKVLEIEQTLVNLHFAKDPCYKDKRDLKNSPYKYAIRKLPFLRILRKSFVGKAAAADLKEWQRQAEEVMEKAKIKN